MIECKSMFNNDDIQYVLYLLYNALNCSLGHNVAMFPVTWHLGGSGQPRPPRALRHCHRLVRRIRHQPAQRPWLPRHLRRRGVDGEQGAVGPGSQQLAQSSPPLQLNNDFLANNIFGGTSTFVPAGADLARHLERGRPPDAGAPRQPQQVQVPVPGAGQPSQGPDVDRVRVQAWLAEVRGRRLLVHPPAEGLLQPGAGSRGHGM